MTAASKKRWYERQKARGLCVCCSKPALPGRTQCAQHREQNKIKAHDQYLRHRGKRQGKVRARSFIASESDL